MPYAIEALQPNLDLTTSNLNDDWLNFLNYNGTIVKATKRMQFNFPKFALDLMGHYVENWISRNTDTTINEPVMIYQYPDIFYEIIGPVMPPNNQFVVNVVVEKIEKGCPSICNEVEAE